MHSQMFHSSPLYWDGGRNLRHTFQNMVRSNQTSYLATAEYYYLMISGNSPTFFFLLAIITTNIISMDFY